MVETGTGGHIQTVYMSEVGLKQGECYITVSLSIVMIKTKRGEEFWAWLGFSTFERPTHINGVVKYREPTAGWRPPLHHQFLVLDLRKYLRDRLTRLRRILHPYLHHVNCWFLHDVKLSGSCDIGGLNVLSDTRVKVDKERDSLFRSA